MTNSRHAVVPRYRAPQRATAWVRWLKRIVHRGGGRYCVVCESRVRKFHHYGYARREDVRCPVCGCVERHRLAWYFFRQRTNLFDGVAKRMLHIGPEPEFERRLRGTPGLDYLTADMQDVHADVQMDITNIQFPDDCFDVIYCSHVLEHVPDDRKAMRELSRVLSPTGWAVILVPIVREATLDDPSITDPAERERLFGQWDHVRAYGPDFVDRLVEAGFSVRVVRAEDLLPDPAVEVEYRFAGEQLFLCTKAQERSP